MNEDNEITYKQDFQCEICGSCEGLDVYTNLGEKKTLCEEHSAGISLAAEEAYRRQRSSLSNSESNQ